MGRSGHITSFAIDVTTLEPYKSCGQVANKAQGSALGSLVPNQKVVLPLLQQNKKDSNKCHYPFYMGRSGLEPPTSPLSGIHKLIVKNDYSLLYLHFRLFFNTRKTK